MMKTMKNENTIGLKAGDKISTWVICENKPKFIEGIIQEEGEGEWCPGDLRLHTSNGSCYVLWFNSAKEAVEHEIEMADFRIEFEKEMQTHAIKELEEEKQYLVDMLAKMK